MPTMKVDRINCALLGRSGVSCAAISGSAGNIASIEMATVATSMAIRAINSGVEIRMPIQT
jgi:hypothetical protein